MSSRLCLIEFSVTSHSLLLADVQDTSNICQIIISSLEVMREQMDIHTYVVLQIRNFRNEVKKTLLNSNFQI